jgi:hypothetical protein
MRRAREGHSGALGQRNRHSVPGVSVSVSVSVSVCVSVCVMCVCVSEREYVCV